MDGENNGKPVLKWDDLGGKPPICCHQKFFSTSKRSRTQQGPSDVPSLDLEMLHVFVPPSKLSWTNTKHHPPPKKKSDPSFIWRFFVVARSENVAFYRSGSPEKMRDPRLPTGIRLCTNSCFSGTQLTLLGIFKGFPLLPSAPVDRPEKTNEKSQVSEDYWL